MPFRALLLSFLFSSFLISNPAFAQTISGSVLDIHSNPQGGVVRVYDHLNNFVGEFGLDHLGNFQTEPLADGTYFAVTAFTHELIDEAWDNVPCENLLCDIPASSPIVVAGGDRTNIDFVLDPILVGGRISGLVTDGSDVPLPYLPLLIRNSDGEHIANTQTDAGGNYQTALAADDSYFVHTAGEPVGLGRELYDNVPCLPGDTCWDTAYVKANGTAVIINGADESGIDFKLEVPAGGLISGQVTDADTGIPLPDVHMDLLDQFGGYLANTDTDQFGNYYFSGLTNGNYKVIAINVPEGYTIELFGGDHCANLECNLTTSGTIITIAGGGEASGKDIVLDYSGTRLLGTITRSDSGAPVASFDAHISADLYDAAGDFIGGWPTNRAGQYQIHLAGAGSYYVVAVNDWDNHGLINEAWDDIKCTHNCDPLDNGATLIPVAESTTVVADFVLDPSFVISGAIQFEGSPTGEGQVNIWDDGGNYVVSGWNDGGGNWMSDRLAAGTYYATARGEDFGMVSQLYNGLSCPQEYCDVTSGTAIELIDSDFAGVNFNLMPFSEDWTISGSIRDSGDNPIGGTVKLFDPFNNPVGDFWTDHLGNFQSHPLADGTYFAITVNTHEMLDEAWDDVPCENMLCDIPSSTAIVINGADRSGIDFVLEPVLIGGRISGQVKDFSDAPLPDVIVQIRNSNGDYLFEEWTDTDGNYQTPLLADDNYFANTLNEPFGLGSELYDDIPCLPADLCGNSAYVAANGTAVVVDGVDKTGIDFKLVVPAGGMITGQVTDEDSSIPLPDVHMNVLDAVGNYVANTNTDPTGVYYFSGLADGDYKVIAIGVPDGYTGELYGGDHCPDWQCDLTTAGSIINISGGAVAGGNDISLDYEGTRLLGTVTRSDTAAPVSSQHAHMGIDLFNESGEHMGGSPTNRAGQFQIELPGAGNYFLVATNDWNYHGLVNEVWDDIQCYHECDPVDLGGTLIPVTEGTTVVADFELDPGFTISGMIQHEGVPAGAGHVNIWGSGGQFVMGSGTDGGGNWMSDPLAAGSYYATTRGEEFSMVSQLYNSLPCPQEFCDVTSGTAIVLSDSDITGINFNLVPISADWTISGSILDSGGSPVGGDIRLVDPFNNFMGEFGTDESGNFQTHTLADGTYFAVTLKTKEVLDEAWDDIPCENLLCDLPSSTPIVISGADRSGIDFVLDPIVNGGHISGQVTDGSGAPLADIGLNVYSSNFEYLFSVSTDLEGNYRTWLQSNDSYYLHTMNEPLGLGRELYDDVHCFIPDRCSRWWFIRNRGTPVVVDGSDVTGIDFMLEVPEGGLISGRVSDADIGIPLPDVHMNLLDPSGNYLRNTDTDATGHYYFSGLADGDYKVIAIEVPHPRYSGELYGGDHCSDFNCDLTTAGTVINISGGAMASGKDIALDYVGTRLTGTITRSDTGAPVSDQHGLMGVDVYRDTGEFFRFFPTNKAGQYSLNPPGARSYYLVTVNDMNTHGLLDEVWDDIRCEQQCDPTVPGAVLIEVPQDTTVVADFILDPEVAFKNGFE